MIAGRLGAQPQARAQGADLLGERRQRPARDIFVDAQRLMAAARRFRQQRETRQVERRARVLAAAQRRVREFQQINQQQPEEDAQRRRGRQRRLYRRPAWRGRRQGLGNLVRLRRLDRRLLRRSAGCDPAPPAIPAATHPARAAFHSAEAAPARRGLRGRAHPADRSATPRRAARAARTSASVARTTRAISAADRAPQIADLPLQRLRIRMVRAEPALLRLPLRLGLIELRAQLHHAGRDRRLRRGAGTAARGVQLVPRHSPARPARAPGPPTGG